MENEENVSVPKIEKNPQAFHAMAQNVSTYHRRSGVSGVAAKRRHSYRQNCVRKFTFSVSTGCPGSSVCSITADVSVQSASVSTR